MVVTMEIAPPKPVGPAHFPEHRMAGLSADFRRELQTLVKARKLYAGPVNSRIDAETTTALRSLAGDTRKP